MSELVSIGQYWFTGRQRCINTAVVNSFSVSVAVYVVCQCQYWTEHSALCWQWCLEAVVLVGHVNRPRKLITLSFVVHFLYRHQPLLTPTYTQPSHCKTTSANNVVSEAVCVSVCVSVYKISRAVTNIYWCNFFGRVGMAQHLVTKTPNITCRSV